MEGDRCRRYPSIFDRYKGFLGQGEGNRDLTCSGEGAKLKPITRNGGA